MRKFNIIVSVPKTIIHMPNVTFIFDIHLLATNIQINTLFTQPFKLRTILFFYFLLFLDFTKLMHSCLLPKVDFFLLHLCKSAILHVQSMEIVEGAIVLILKHYKAHFDFN